MRPWGSQKTLWIGGFLYIGCGLFFAAVLGWLLWMFASHGEVDGNAAIPALFVAVGLMMVAVGGASAAHSRMASGGSRAALRVCCAAAVVVPAAVAGPLLILEGRADLLPLCLLGAFVALPVYGVARRFDRGDDRPLISFGAEDSSGPGSLGSGTASGKGSSKKRPVAAIAAVAVLAGLILFNGCARLGLSASRDEWRRDAAELEERGRALEDYERAMDGWDPGRLEGAAEDALELLGPQVGGSGEPAEGGLS